MVTHFEYREQPPNYPTSPLPMPANGREFPAAMGITKLDQDKRTGVLEVVDYDNISFAMSMEDGSTAPLPSRLGIPTWGPKVRARCQDS